MIKINNIDELQKIGNDPEYPLYGEYELTQDIDASDTINWNNGAGFKPIGTQKNPFIGKFDGNGHKIDKLYINRPRENDIGLFGYIKENGEVMNLKLENCIIKGNFFVGGLAGQNHSKIKNSSSTGSVDGVSYVGGLVGLNNIISIEIVKSFVNYVGGLVGQNNIGAEISESYSTTTVVGQSENVGGLVGENYGGKIDKCYSNGSARGTSKVGGLVGRNEWTEGPDDSEDIVKARGSVSRSYSESNVSGIGPIIGGLIGYNIKGIIKECYSAGSVTSDDLSTQNTIGGLIGYNYDYDYGGKVQDSYWDTQISGKTISAGGIGKTTAEMKKKATYENWDFVNIWDIKEDITYPFFR
ncbi:MAG TPA: GLUG motif-containing protein [Candidatus Hydrogenedens sp.]|nr:GLUG motif-containing protein [Candidatus Hydrogenedens sp.]